MRKASKDLYHRLVELLSARAACAILTFPGNGASRIDTSHKFVESDSKRGMNLDAACFW